MTRSQKKILPTPDELRAKAAEQLATATANADLLAVDASAARDNLATAEQRIASARNSVQRAQASLAKAMDERLSCRTALRSLVQPYLLRGASATLASQVTGLSIHYLTGTNDADHETTLPDKMSGNNIPINEVGNDDYTEVEL